jgi:Protein of unknown function (DUF732)
MRTALTTARCYTSEKATTQLKITQALTAGIAALALAAPAPTTMATLTAAPAKADISCPNGFVPPSVSADCYFLYMMNKDGIGGDSQEELISSAHAMCTWMTADTGVDPVSDATMVLSRQKPALGLRSAALIAGISAAAYCPSVVRR